MLWVRTQNLFRIYVWVSSSECILTNNISARFPFPENFVSFKDMCEMSCI